MVWWHWLLIAVGVWISSSVVFGVVLGKFLYDSEREWERIRG